MATARATTRADARITARAGGADGDRTAIFCASIPTPIQVIVTEP